MKVYVLTVSKFFPSYHPKKGLPTSFVEQILARKKTHTIRKNYELWEHRVKNVNAGIAIISLRYWSGKPYNSKQVEFFQLTKESGIGIQQISLTYIDKALHFVRINKKIWFNTNFYFVSNVRIKMYLWKLLAVLCPRDGFSNEQDFHSWFKRKSVQSAALIHFTKFRYL